MDNSDEDPASTRDGLIDFGSYTTEQLVELESSIDPERFPRNHAHLVEELNRRKRTEARNFPPCNQWDIRFSRSESFWSWIQAKRRRQWFYGRGSLEIHPTEIQLSGWQRTWLGMPVQGERRIALESIRNVGRDNDTVLISIAGRSRFGRKFEFDCDSAQSAPATAREWRESPHAPHVPVVTVGFPASEPRGLFCAFRNHSVALGRSTIFSVAPEGSLKTPFRFRPSCSGLVVAIFSAPVTSIFSPYSPKT